MKRFAIALSMLALGACAGGERVPVRIYDFGLAPAAAPAAVSVHVLAVTSPAWLDVQDMLYRLAYRDPLALEPYAFSRWAGTPPAMLTLRLRQTFGTLPARQARCALQVNLSEFSQVFSRADASRATLHASAVVYRLNGDRQRDQLELRLERDAPTPDAAGAAAAFSALADELTVLLRDWVAGTGYCG